MTEFTEIATGLRFPEGPVAMADGSVCFVQIEKKRVSKVTAEGEIVDLAAFDGGPNGLAVGPDGAFYVANNGGFAFATDDHGGLRVAGTPHDYSGGRIERLDPATGEITRYTDTADSGFALRGPNDLVFDGEGGLWFTDMGKRRPRDLDYGGVYWLSPDRQTLKEVAYPVLTANGIGLSPDDKTLYVAETEAARLWAFDIVGPGEVKKRGYPSRSGGRLVYAAGMPSQRFDSLALEANGNICVATLVRGGITVVSPEGALVEFVSLPDVTVTNICFGGPDLKTAYITLSNGGRLIRMDWPRPGLPLHFLNR